MSKPMIGISGSIMVDGGGMFPGYHRAYVNEDYVTSVRQNGGIPVIIPVAEDEELITATVAKLDGLILSGGHDVDPRFYNEDPQQKLGETLPLRDRFDFALIKAAEARNLPILGICRGAQILTVYHGGRLYQDLSYRQEATLRHWQNSNPSLVTHAVTVTPDTHLAAAVTADKTDVNSFHHQLIREVPTDFVVSARANDGVVEAIESTTAPFTVGVQFHPEMLHTSAPIFGKLFDKLITVASEGDRR